jgi:DHHC palmitoyltransferase
MYCRISVLCFHTHTRTLTPVLSLFCSHWLVSRLCVGDPGYVDATESDVNSSITTICTICRIQRPPRAHHCRVCDKCVKKRDHHCPYTANCIGMHNEGDFALFVTYSCMLTIVLLWLTYMYYFQVRHNMHLCSTLPCFRYFGCNEEEKKHRLIPSPLLSSSLYQNLSPTFRMQIVILLCCLSSMGHLVEELHVLLHSYLEGMRCNQLSHHNAGNCDLSYIILALSLTLTF